MEDGHRWWMEVESLSAILMSTHQLPIRFVRKFSISNPEYDSTCLQPSASSAFLLVVIISKPSSETYRRSGSPVEAVISVVDVYIHGHCFKTTNSTLYVMGDRQTLQSRRRSSSLGRAVAWVVDVCVRGYRGFNPIKSNHIDVVGDR